MNTSNFYFRMPMSLSLGLMTYVGGEMGMNRVSYAKKYTIAGIFAFSIFCLVLCILFYFLRDAWASFYASDPTVKEILIDAYLIFMLGCLIIDGF